MWVGGIIGERELRRFSLKLATRCHCLGNVLESKAKLHSQKRYDEESSIGTRPQRVGGW